MKPGLLFGQFIQGFKNWKQWWTYDSEDCFKEEETEEVDILDMRVLLLSSSFLSLRQK